ncbi:MAG: hypothetical protein COV71_00130 [Candidatus Omnitrophica bacterium CG11_big_fil_rev_8_21_14_0_20_41_12]|nr:MAG: hypothetical protein COV71_00130 [Candidatus Omnitrophica bacterium CG11_big_fil_rev_8_21_14_0_20_41_12]
MNLANIQLDKQKKILIVIFCILIAYVDMNYILKAQLAGLDSLNPKVVRLDKDLKNLNSDLERMNLAKGKPGLAAQKPTGSSSKIISEGEVSGLLQDIANAANKLGIRVIQIRPMRETQIAKTTAISGELTPVLINLDLICDYHNLGRLINELENSFVFMGVQELKISTQLPDYLKQKVTLVIKTYVSK